MTAEHLPRSSDAPTARSTTPSVRAADLIRQRSSPNYWADLCADLLGEFPSVDRSVLIEEIVRARAATSLFGLDVREQVRWTATIARNNLRLLTGGADLARLDPESHDRRKHDA